MFYLKIYVIIPSFCDKENTIIDRIPIKQWEMALEFNKYAYVFVPGSRLYFRRSDKY